VSEAEIRTLSAAIRRHGKATLLWISEANEDHPAETVERLDEGLLHGWISHFTPMDVVMTTDPMKWMPVLRRAWTMTHGGDPSNIRPHARPNLLPRAFGHWVGHDAATCDHIWHLPPCPLGGMAITHRLISQRPDGSPAYGCLVTDDLIPGEMYVASAYVWIPDDFAPTIVSMELHGTMSVYFKIADLSRRNCWQLTWVCGRMATDSTVMFPRIRVGGQLGAIMHSAGWRFEKGAVPRNMPLIG
jgi:hypothetical protein